MPVNIPAEPVSFPLLFLNIEFNPGGISIARGKAIFKGNILQRSAQTIE